MYMDTDGYNGLLSDAVLLFGAASSWKTLFCRRTSWTDTRATISRPIRLLFRTVFWCNRKRWTRRTRALSVRRRPRRWKNVDKKRKKFFEKKKKKPVVSPNSDHHRCGVFFFYFSLELTCFASTMYDGRFGSSGTGGAYDGRSEDAYGSWPWWNLLCSYWIQFSSKKLIVNSNTHIDSRKHTTNGNENHFSLMFRRVSWSEFRFFLLLLFFLPLRQKCAAKIVAGVTWPVALSRQLRLNCARARSTCGESRPNDDPTRRIANVLSLFWTTCIFSISVDVFGLIEMDREKKKWGHYRIS